MNKIIMTVALLLTVSGCGTVTEQTITENAVITLKNYGAFSPVEMSTQILTIDKDMTTLKYYDADGALTKEFTKKTDSASFSALIDALIQNDFLGMDAIYTFKEGQPVVTDVGIGEMTVSDGIVIKTVKVDPYFEDYMPDGLKTINGMLESAKLGLFTMTQPEAQALAETWIRNSKTYRNGGSDLTLVNAIVEESMPEQHILTYTFTSSHAGYGETKTAAQTMTNHTIVVTVFMREVIDAVIDGTWDERSQSEISSGDGYQTFSYQPKQCVTLPWVTWKEESIILWDKEPTEEQLVMTYLGGMGVDAVDFRRVETDAMVCQACDVCPTTYYYTVEVLEASAAKIKELGWTESAGG